MSQFSLRLLTALFSIALLTSVAMAQDTATMQALRDKVKADKKLVISANMDLTEEEGKKFWPIYDAYQKDLAAINQRLATAITTYATAYNCKCFRRQLFRLVVGQRLAVDEDEVKLRKTYGAKLAQVLPGKKAARYLQLENKIRAALRYDLATAIPLVE